MVTELQNGGTIAVNAMSKKMGIPTDTIIDIVDNVTPHAIYVDTSLKLELGHHIVRTIDLQSI